MTKVGEHITLDIFGPDHFLGYVSAQVIFMVAYSTLLEPPTHGAPAAMSSKKPASWESGLLEFRETRLRGRRLLPACPSGCLSPPACFPHALWPAAACA